MFPILDFMADENVSEGFITGPGGSGKTEMLIQLVDILSDCKITYQIVAYTNKAVEVIQNRVPKAPASTLHSWLKKRPEINSKAKHLGNVMISYQYDKPEPLQLLIVDEFSMIGEADYFSIGEMIDPELKGEIKLKTLYIGDLSQLSPIKGICPIYPGGDYWIKLTKVYRNTNSLQEPLQGLREAIEDLENGNDIGASICLPFTEHFSKVTINISRAYMQHPSDSKVLLAYTNEQVQNYNAMLQGRTLPELGDVIFNSTSKKVQTITGFINKTDIMNYEVYTMRGFINKDTKYNPLKTLSQLDFVRFVEVTNNDSTSCDIIPIIFGAYTNKRVRESLGRTLVDLNKENKDSAQAYKVYKCVSDYTFSVDFNHCITTHKTQGSEWDYVFIDMLDYNKCINQLDRLKLMYVGISRAKVECFVNN